MTQDIEPNPPALALGVNARLCNFATNSSQLLLAHQRWITGHVIPAVRAAPESPIRLAGIASRLGSVHHNEQLALSRAQAVGDFKLSSRCKRVCGTWKSLVTASPFPLARPAIMMAIIAL
ncbi:MAG: hypothetical protein HC889_10340 [Synechococcaceae cyanobacterium SM1_2_3]|nr:hypothetical protein [Synechococcaceae cyanobacterium SM1_2_3]